MAPISIQDDANVADLSKLDLQVIQIDGLHIGNDLVLIAALGIDGEGHKHPLALIEGATENAAVSANTMNNPNHKREGQNGGHLQFPVAPEYEVLSWIAHLAFPFSVTQRICLAETGYSNPTC
jgi:hypothetical protein